jgi:hypothetical protein
LNFPANFLFKRLNWETTLTIYRRSRMRSLLSYFCYGCCCLAILKMKIFLIYWLENNTNLERVRRTELKYLQWFSDRVCFGRISAPMWKKFSPNFMGEYSQYHGDKIIQKNWLIKAFSNEIKSRTFSCLLPGFYLFWLTNIFFIWSDIKYDINSKISFKKYLYTFEKKHES